MSDLTQKIDLLTTVVSELKQQQLERDAEQSEQIKLLKQQLEEQQSYTLDLLSHIEQHLKGEQKPPVPISQAWEPLGFKSEVALRGAIRREVYTVGRGEILRRGTSILVNVQKCLENGYEPIHRRRRSA